MKRLFVLLFLAMLIFSNSNDQSPALKSVQAQSAAAPSQGDVIEDGDPYVIFLPLVANGDADTNIIEDPLAELIARLSNGNPDQVVGTYVADVMAAAVVQQPDDDAQWVSSQADTLTDYRAASLLGSIGLLARNDQAGALFSQLQIDDTISIINGDGSLRAFEVKVILRFQAVDPADPGQGFIETTSENFVPEDFLFQIMYNADERVVLQTNLAQDGCDTWGRLYVVAFPPTLDEAALDHALQSLHSFQK